MDNGELKRTQPESGFKEIVLTHEQQGFVCESLKEPLFKFNLDHVKRVIDKSHRLVLCNTIQNHLNNFAIGRDFTEIDVRGIPDEVVTDVLNILQDAARRENLKAIFTRLNEARLEIYFVELPTNKNAGAS